MNANRCVSKSKSLSSTRKPGVPPRRSPVDKSKRSRFFWGVACLPGMAVSSCHRNRVVVVVVVVVVVGNSSSAVVIWPSFNFFYLQNPTFLATATQQSSKAESNSRCAQQKVPVASWQRRLVAAACSRPPSKAIPEPARSRSHSRSEVKFPFSFAVCVCVFACVFSAFFCLQPPRPQPRGAPGGSKPKAF